MNLWTESYRPNKLTDLLASDLLNDQLNYICNHGNESPHLMLMGLPGLGKTSSAHALIREWYSNTEDRKYMVLELNASHDRGIQMIRDKVIPFFYQRRIPRCIHPVYNFIRRY